MVMPSDVPGAAGVGTSELFGTPEQQRERDLALLKLGQDMGLQRAQLEETKRRTDLAYGYASPGEMDTARKVLEPLGLNLPENATLRRGLLNSLLHYGLVYGRYDPTLQIDPNTLEPVGQGRKALPIYTQPGEGSIAPAAPVGLETAQELGTVGGPAAATGPALVAPAEPDRTSIGVRSSTLAALRRERDLKAKQDAADALKAEADRALTGFNEGERQGGRCHACHFLTLEHRLAAPALAIASKPSPRRPRDSREAYAG